MGELPGILQDDRRCKTIEAAPRVQSDLPWANQPRGMEAGRSSRSRKAHATLEPWPSQPSGNLKGIPRLHNPPQGNRNPGHHPIGSLEDEDRTSPGLAPGLTCATEPLAKFEPYQPGFGTSWQSSTENPGENRRDCGVAVPNPGALYF